MSQVKIAVCQMDSQDNKEMNLQTACKMIDDACAEGAQIIAFPETMNFIGKGLKHMAESIPGTTTDILSAKAKEHGVWIISGSFPEINDSGKPANTLVLINPIGEIVCKYSKIHMFDIDVEGAGKFMESAHNAAGNEIVLADTDFGRIGFAICYDLRFAEQFRLLALNGARIIFMPSCFTKATGKAHWETLIKARAIENGVYMIAPDQTGEKINMTAFGNSIAVDPWGNVIAIADEEAGYFIVDVDTDKVDSIRGKLPSLANRKTDVYSLTSENVKIY